MLNFKDTNSFRQAVKKLTKQNSVLGVYIATAINTVRSNPEAGEMKKGDLQGIRCLDIRLKNQNYELAYSVEEDEEGNPTLVLLLLVGSRENFYKELKRLI